MLSKEDIENAYWSGFAQAETRAHIICKECSHRNRLKKLETEKQKLIEKLETDNERNRNSVIDYESNEKKYNK